MQLFPQVCHLCRRYQAQVAAFQVHLRHGGQETQGPDPIPEAPPDGVPEAGIGHGGAPVQDDAPDGGVRAEIQKALERGKQGEGSPPRPQDEDHRGPGGGAHVVGAGFGGVHPQAVVVAHDPFHDADIPALSVLGQERVQGVRIEEKGIQVRAVGPNDPAVEHGVDVVRPAFEGPGIQAPVRKGLEQGAGDGGLPAAAVRSRQSQPGHLGIHEHPSQRKTAAARKCRRGRLPAVVVFPRPNTRGLGSLRSSRSPDLRLSGARTPSRVSPMAGQSSPVRGLRAYIGGTAPDLHRIPYSPRPVRRGT